MEPATTAALINAGGNAIGSLLGMLESDRRNKRAFRQEQQLMDQQYGNQQGLMEQQFMNQQQLNQQGHDLQMEMWRNTNAPAQVGMLREAGLNPALMYKQGGAGGVTGNQGGGSAAGGNAAGGRAPNQPNIGDMLTFAQLGKIKADTKLVNAQAVNEAKGVKEKLQAEIDKIVAEKNWKEQVLKTEVQKTEQERLEALMKKADEEWMRKYKVTRNDTAAIKTILRARGIADDLLEGGATDEEIEETIEALHNNVGGSVKVFGYDPRLND